MSRSHGTRAKYVVEQCRCEPCRAANTAYALFDQKRRRLGRSEGAWAMPLVDAGPVRDHIADLRAAGVGVRQIARVSGVARNAIWSIISGRSVRCRRETAAAIFAVEPTDRARGRYWRPAQDRVPLGPLLAHHPASAIADALGVHRRQVHRWRRDGIPVDVADRAAVALGHYPPELWP